MVWTVLIAATITAVFTGLGALPFLFIKDISKRWLGIANAGAAGLMLGASIGLIAEGAVYGLFRLSVGLALGLVLIVFAHKWLENSPYSDVTDLTGTNTRGLKVLLVVGIMTVHSFAEGIGVGVAYGDGQAFGTFITAAIAIHNIPEGLAISLVMIPRGASVWRAAGWSIFSSLPQPIMAVLAFLFVLVFKPILPFGLGLAAGAMIWMVFLELLPEAQEHISQQLASAVMAVAVVAMMGFQVLIG